MGDGAQMELLEEELKVDFHHKKMMMMKKKSYASLKKNRDRKLPSKNEGVKNRVVESFVSRKKWLRAKVVIVERR